MDKFYAYHTTDFKARFQRTRHSVEKFDRILEDFLSAYTNTNLEELTLTYELYRLSDREFFEHWLSISKYGMKPLSPLETDREVEETLKFLDGLNVLDAVHLYKGDKEFDKINHLEKHTYKIHINSYHELLNIIKSKNNRFSRMFLTIEVDFIFKNFDYDDPKLLVVFSKRPDYFSRIWLHISIDENDEQKLDHGLIINLIFPKFTETEKDFLREIEKELKINFWKNKFGYYYVNSIGKKIFKKEIVEL